MTAVTEQDRGQEYYNDRFALIVMEAFPAEPQSATLARHWVDKVFTQIAAGTTERRVSERIGDAELVSDSIIDQIAKANTPDITKLVAGVSTTRRDDVLLATTELVTNSIKYGGKTNLQGPSFPERPLPIDNLDLLEAALDGGSGVDEVILAQFGKPTTRQFVVAVAVDVANQRVSILSGDGNPSRGNSDAKKDSLTAVSGRGRKIVSTLSDRSGYDDGSKVTLLRERTGLPLAKAAEARFSPGAKAQAPRPRTR